jgi:hypothetical protein
MARIGGESIAIPRLPIGLLRYSWCIRGQNIYVNTSDRQKGIVRWSNRSSSTLLVSPRSSIFSTQIPQDHSRELSLKVFQQLIGQSKGKPDVGIARREWPSSAFIIVSVLLLVSVDNLRSNHRRYFSGLSANRKLSRNASAKGLRGPQEEIGAQRKIPGDFTRFRSTARPCASCVSVALRTRRLM